MVAMAGPIPAVLFGPGGVCVPAASDTGAAPAKRRQYLRASKIKMASPITGAATISAVPRSRVAINMLPTLPRTSDSAIVTTRLFGAPRRICRHRSSSPARNRKS